MLHATEKNKTRLYKRYQGVREFDVHGNITAEDEITSLLFGPLEFMTPAAVWCIAMKMLGDKAPTKAILPSKFELNFWPKLTSGIEPDATLVFDWEDGEQQIAILFEMKWNASLSGDDQLHNQWHDFRALHGDNAYHLFIAKKNTVKAVKDKFKNQQRPNWGDKLICLTWNDMCAILGKVVEEDGRALCRWASLANNFLLLATGMRPFGGFGISAGDDPEGFGCYSFPDFSTLTKPLYWDDHWFAQLDKLISAELPLHQPLFFAENNHD
jgi:hypothetical protein